MARRREEPRSQPLVFARADPEELARFDIRTKVCTANCGPHRDDPRTPAERRLLCTECVPAPSCTRRGCDGVMLPGLAILQTYTGIGDFGVGDVVTLSPGGRGVVVECLKCNTCGHSVLP